MSSLDRAAWARLFGAWLIALVATAGALFLGEVMGKTPCVLCWYQRIAMFPLVPILGLGLLSGDARSARYAAPLVWIGAAIALWHCLLVWGIVSESLSPCGAGASCADADVQVAGRVPIPLLSLISFALIGALLWTVKQERVTR
jgi:disulfide bond formation protein DsbB